MQPRSRRDVAADAQACGDEHGGDDRDGRAQTSQYQHCGLLVVRGQRAGQAGGTACRAGAEQNGHERNQDDGCSTPETRPAAPTCDD